MATYTPADDETIALMHEVMAAYHERLLHAGVTIGVLMAAAPVDNETGEPKGNALTHNSKPAIALARIIAHRERVQGVPDGVIDLDGDKWTFFSREERAAILDHELEHFEIVVKDGVVTTDDGGRPKLRMKPHDFDVGWFRGPALRHGKNSQEVQQGEQMLAEDGFAFMPSLNLPVPAEQTANEQRLEQHIKEFAKLLAKSGTTATVEVGGKSITLGKKG